MFKSIFQKLHMCAAMLSETMSLAECCVRNETSSISVTVAVIPYQNKFGSWMFYYFPRPEFHKMSFETSHLRV